MNLIYEGHDIQFDLKYETERFAHQYKLEIEYDDGGLIDEEHYNVKGYESKLYWYKR